MGAASPHPHVMEALPGSNAESEADVAIRARDDVNAFTQLYRKHVGAVYRYCFHRLGSRQAAEDATSEIFLKAFAGISGCRDADSFRSWLFAIAHNTVNDAYRRRRPEESLAMAELFPDPAPGPEERAVAADESQWIRALLARLTPQQARIVELRLAGLRGAEIAEVLGCSLGAVKGLQVRGYGRLRNLLGAQKDHDHA